ncbi:hypothetical protein LCGC14_2894210 [marine sediment metagenome]|uniref:Uncharacterized protein n=1 Tax=marine sediment metagenome TaxID=412755 RepID=A0A0F9AMJ2_9ZZZZ
MKKLHELIADRIRNYKPVSIPALRKWELLAIDQANAIDLIDDMAGKILIEKSTYDEMMKKMDNIDAGLERVDTGIDQFHEFLVLHMGVDWYSRMIIKFNEWKEKQKEYKEISG